MSDIVLKRAIVASGYGPVYKRARLAYNMARRYYPRAQKAARTIGRYYRKYRRTRRRFSKAGLGKTPGSSTSKRNTPINFVAPVQYDTKTLYTQNLISMAHAGSNDINTRQRNIVNVRGIKLCMEVQNLQEVPLYVNIAVLSNKQGANVQTTDFFRGDGVQRAADFTASTINGLEYHCRPINIDKYHVWWHRRYRLNALAQLNNDSTNGKTYFNIDKYLKINRQFQFLNNADTIPENNAPQLVWWCSVFMSSDVTPVLTNAMQMTQRAIVYFREPK